MPKKAIEEFWVSVQISKFLRKEDKSIEDLADAIDINKKTLTKLLKKRVATASILEKCIRYCINCEARHIKEEAIDTYLEAIQEEFPNWEPDKSTLLKPRIIQKDVRLTGTSGDINKEYQRINSNPNIVIKFLTALIGFFWGGSQKAQAASKISAVSKLSSINSSAVILSISSILIVATVIFAIMGILNIYSLTTGLFSSNDQESVTQASDTSRSNTENGNTKPDTTPNFQPKKINEFKSAENNINDNLKNINEPIIGSVKNMFFYTSWGTMEPDNEGVVTITNTIGVHAATLNLIRINYDENFLTCDYSEWYKRKKPEPVDCAPNKLLSNCTLSEMIDFTCYLKPTEKVVELTFIDDKSTRTKLYKYPNTKQFKCSTLEPLVQFGDKPYSRSDWFGWNGDIHLVKLEFTSGETLFFNIFPSNDISDISDNKLSNIRLVMVSTLWPGSPNAGSWFVYVSRMEQIVLLNANRPTMTRQEKEILASISERALREPYTINELVVEEKDIISAILIGKMESQAEYMNGHFVFYNCGTPLFGDWVAEKTRD